MVFMVVAMMAAAGSVVRADVTLPAMFTDHAVLQRDMRVPVWGWASPGEEVHVALAGQTLKTKADDHGKWQVTLEPLALGKPLRLVVEGKNRLEVNDIVVGEVWLCSGQSNMELAVSAVTNGDLAIAGSENNQIRLIRSKGPACQRPAKDFAGEWQLCSPGSVAGFSAVGYFFGRELNEQLDVPIGLIDNSWGGSACEAWVRRERLEEANVYSDLLKKWDKLAQGFDEEAWNSTLATWLREVAEARSGGKPVPPGPKPANHQGMSHHRPANLYNGRLAPVMPYAIRGAIWYQGETNAGRAYQYRELFPLMIESWRKEWNQGDFPFYWVQLADFRAEQAAPGESTWAELREAQTWTQDKLPNTGEAVIIDLGESADIHPRKKLDVGLRLARWALARDYGKTIEHESPRYESMRQKDGKIVLKFQHVGRGLQVVDAKDPAAQKSAAGFAIAGADHQWHWAKANITKRDEIEVWSDDVKEPVAVRYAWAENPVCNVFTESFLPLTPFRTDDWPGITVNANQ
ncbi:MAG: sialate O-acetylesterase [Pirellulales bacterium]|nr:sialate O-acetylesterase [Pirellulales bacterium]